MPALEITDLRIRIRGAELLKGVTLTLEPGQRLALLGASGSGKSLTAAAVIRQSPPAASARGSIRVQGKEVLHLPTLRRPRRSQSRHGVSGLFRGTESDVDHRAPAPRTVCPAGHVDPEGN